MLDIFRFTDLDRILAVNRQGYLRQETEIGKETEIERETEKEIVIAREIASEIETVTYCPDIDRQSDHLPGMRSIKNILIYIILEKTHFLKCV